MSARPLLEDYIRRIKETLDGLDLEAVEGFFKVLQETVGTDRRVYVMGNGGSAAAATHMACDLANGLREATGRAVPMIALTDNLSVITAIANDTTYTNVFVDQLRCYLRPGDVVVVISGSGNSENVVRAARYAREAGCTTVGIVGFDGGRIKPMVDHCVHVEVHDMQIAEDLQLVLDHMALRYFMQQC